MVLVLWCGDSCAGGVLMVVLVLWYVDSGTDVVVLLVCWCCW